MIDVLDIVISNQEAVSKELDIIYSSNMKQYRARFTFSDNSWDGYNKIVIFDRVKNYDTPIGLIIKDKTSELVEIVNDREFYCIIPWEILVQPGYFTISLYGTITDGEPKKKTIVINNKFTIQNSGNTTVYPRIPTPNIYEQLLGIIDTENIKEDLEILEKELEIFEKKINKKIEEQPTSYVFNNLEELNNNLLNRDFVDKLIVGDNFYIKDIDTPDYWWNGEDIQSIEAKPSDLGDKIVGQKTENGGEIFNDYENNKALSGFTSARGKGNIAGCRGFNILNLQKSNDGMYLLRITNFDNIEDGDRFSLYSEKLGKNLDLCGEVITTGAGPELLDIEVRGLPEELYPLSGNTQEYIWFPQKPEVNGDILLGTGAEANGYYTKAMMIGSHTEGYNTVAGGKYAHAEGRSTQSRGEASHTEGNETVTRGDAAHAEGANTEANGAQSHSEGWQTTVDGQQAHIEGRSSNLKKNITSSENSSEIKNAWKGLKFAYAKGTGAHVEGRDNLALGDFTHAEGRETIAEGYASHTAGFGTKAVGQAQTVVGQFNIPNGESYFIVGNGSDSNNPSTAFKVNHDGTAELQTSGVNDNNVVIYSQLVNYVRDNAKSKWDDACKLLFTEAKHNWDDYTISEGGDIYINNHQANTDYSNSYISIGSAYSQGTGNEKSLITNSYFKVEHLAFGTNCQMSQSGILLALYNGTDFDYLNEICPSIHIQGVDYYGESYSVDIGLMGITHQNKFAPWENIVEAANLFSDNYDLQIKNHPSSNESFSSITIGEAQSNESGMDFSRLDANGLYVHNVMSGNTSTYDESKVFIRTSCIEDEDYKGYIHLEHTIKADDSSEINTDNLKITASSIEYNGRVFEWKRIFDAIEKIENIIDVSVNGQ